MCVIFRWKIKKLHGYLSPAYTVINSQLQELGPNSKMRKERSKINISVGIISQKSCILMIGELPNNKSIILFCHKSSVDAINLLKRACGEE